MDVKCIERYLENFDQSHIQGKLLDTIVSTSKGGARFPILFFAAERNSPEIVIMLCQRGADIDRRLEPLREPINVESKDLVRNVFVNFVDDGQIAKHLAAEHYDPQAGASSLRLAVERDISLKLATAWSGEEELIVDEMNERPLPNYDVTVATTPENDSEISVKRRGTRELQLPPQLS